ncbi:MAG: DNA-3-methyladenine glycosylase 2 family protein [Mycobacteriaceae bacterium]
MSGCGERSWRPDFVVNLPTVLRPLRRGRSDPTSHSEGTRLWRASNTPEGPLTLAVAVTAGGTVHAHAWGPGADWGLAGLPALLGADDDPGSFTCHHDRIAAAVRAVPHLRLGATGAVWDVLLGAVLEQKVTGTEARRSWRELVWRFGDPAPGPAPEGLRLPPSPEQLLRIPDWEWHRAGVDLSRRRALLGAASVAHRLERATQLRGESGRELLRKVRGVGVWTAAEVAQRAWGDPDAVSFGDFHIPSVVGWALVGRPLDDDGMATVLAPYAPQRQRAVRLLEATGAPRPRFGPRLAPTDYRRY